ncbi:MAG: alpha/beta fold hydrolase [Syntrophobacteraceae bacterium]|jgi:homoserine O-acetyltransferase
MKPAIRSMLFLFLFFIVTGAAHGNEALRFAELGDFRLENNEVIRDCRLGYRTLGNLNSEKSNAVLFPTWFAGTTRDLIDTGNIGPGKLIDTSRFYVIAVESLGNGVSSSPSNSKEQSGQSFPQFSIRDMVDAEYLLLTRELHLTRIHAVVGISMGGMQVFQWMVSYPEVFKRAVSIVGSPRLASSDLLRFQSEIMAIDTGRSCGDAGRGMNTVSAIHSLALYTPGYIAMHTSPEEFPGYLAGIVKGIARFSPDDWEWQLKAIMGQDIYRTFGGSPERTASAVRAKTLVIVSQQDQMVNPEPARVFSRLINAEVLELEGNCGHAAFICEKEKLAGPVMKFLEQ